MSKSNLTNAEGANTRSSHLTGSSIGRISLTVEVNGKPCFVVLPHDRLMLLVKLAASLSDDGKLPVMGAPEGFRFQCLQNVEESNPETKAYE